MRFDTAWAKDGLSEAIPESPLDTHKRTFSATTANADALAEKPSHDGCSKKAVELSAMTSGSIVTCIPIAATLVRPFRPFAARAMTIGHKTNFALSYSTGRFAALLLELIGSPRKDSSEPRMLIFGMVANSQTIESSARFLIAHRRTPRS